MKRGRSHVIGLCVSAALALAAGDGVAGGHNQVKRAQSSPRSNLQTVAVVPAPPPPTNAELAAFAGPNPAGLQSAFPAGLPPPGTPVPPTLAPTPPIFVPISPIFGVPGQPVGSVGRFAGGAYGAGAAGYAGGIAVGAADSLPMTAGNAHTGPYSAVEIAKSFIEADANRDGVLTPAEAQHLAIMPKSFEGMDTNHDGVVTRWEYEDAFR